MNAQHTPGPWKTDRAGVNVIDPRESNEYVLAYCKGSTLSEVQSNARLIASAPELLEALERLVDDYERVKRFAHDNGLQWVGSSQAPDWQARQVIAKARGQA